jgi:hypothetical protein
MLAEDIGRRRAFNPASYPASSAILAWLPIIIACPLQKPRLAVGAADGYTAMAGIASKVTERICPMAFVFSINI